MAIPSFFQGTVRYKSVPAVTDVQAIIDNFRTEALALPSGEAWIEGPTGTFQTPTNSAGQYFKMTLTRVSATRLSAQMTDHVGRTITKTFDIPGAGSTVDIYVSGRHVIFAVLGNNEGLWWAILDLDPLPQNAHDRVACGHASRDSAGTITSWNTRNATLHGPSSPYNYTVTNALAFLAPEAGGDNIVPIQESIAGAFILQPVWIGIVGTANGFLRGRVPHIVALSTSIGAGNEKSIPLDETVTATFKVLPFPTDLSNSAFRLAARRS